MATSVPSRPLIDGLGRTIRYLRLSVTDRCDFRCRYCMAEKMDFLPRDQALSIEEMIAVAEAFIDRGVTKIRLTGGEPMVRRGFATLARALGRHVAAGTLDELTLTTNGSRLAEESQTLVDAGIRRINVSLDSRDRERFRHITRWGELDRVLAGIAAAKAAGLAIKINMVALKGLNDDEIEPMLHWCSDEGFDLTLIETMPLGLIDEDRSDRFLPLTAVRDALAARYRLTSLAEQTGGPARYWRVDPLGVKLGLISPLTENFCAGCNRVRLAASGRLYMCLGHEDHVDLKTALRSGGRAAVDALLDRAMAIKPARHDFSVAAGAAPATRRHMSVTGG